MSFIDDWGGTSLADRTQLQEECTFAGCSHPRYRHGDAQQIRYAGVRGVAYSPGKCECCRCEVFRNDIAITGDDVLDVADQLAGDIHLSDFGVTEVACRVVITRFLQSGPIDLPCYLTAGHGGVHTAKE